jgi:hypothetical protein
MKSCAICRLISTGWGVSTEHEYATINNFGSNSTIYYHICSIFGENGPHVDLQFPHKIFVFWVARLFIFSCIFVLIVSSLVVERSQMVCGFLWFEEMPPASRCINFWVRLNTVLFFPGIARQTGFGKSSNYASQNCHEWIEDKIGHGRVKTNGIPANNSLVRLTTYLLY